MAKTARSGDSDFDRICRGDLENLPERSSNVVCIFLSSTFTDYAEERNLLTRDAIPRLKNYCRERGVELEIADMRWGVRDDAQVDHKTTEVCLQEIRHCRKNSVGPYFVTFLGNKYGYRPYPSKIDVTEFTTLRRAARMAFKDTRLLDEWYVLDENSIPATYVLQPITAKYPHYNDETDENEDLRKKDREEWDAVDSLLANTFRTAAMCAFKYKKFTAEQKHKYYKSVTEEEVAEGILTHPDDNRALCFFRTFDKINHNDPKAKRFMDLEGGQVDQEPANLLKDLRSTRVPRAMRKVNMESYDIPWTPNGIDTTNDSHVTYLASLNEKFYQKVRRQIDDCLAAATSSAQTKNHYDEVLHHAIFCREKCETFCGRREMLKVIQQKLCEVFQPDILEEETLDEKLTAENKPKKSKKKEARTQAADENDEGEEEDARDEEKEEVAKEERGQDPGRNSPLQMSPDGRHENLLEKVIVEEDEEALAAEEKMTAAQSHEQTDVGFVLKLEKAEEKRHRKELKAERRRRKKAAIQEKGYETSSESSEDELTESQREEQKQKKKEKRRQRKRELTEQEGRTEEERLARKQQRKEAKKQRREKKRRKKLEKKQQKALKGTADSDSSDYEALTGEQKAEKKLEKKEKKRLKKLAKKDREALKDTSDSDSSDYESLTAEQKVEKKRVKKLAKKAKKALEGTSDSDSSDCEGLNEEQKTEKKQAKKEKKKLAKKEKKALEGTSDSDSSDYEGLNEEQKVEKKQAKKEKKRLKKIAKKEKKALEGTSDSDSSDCEGLNEEQKTEKKLGKKEKKRLKKLAKKDREALKDTFDSDSSDYEGFDEEQKVDKKQAKKEKKRLKKIAKKEKKALEGTSDSDSSDYEGLTGEQKSEKKQAKKEKRRVKKLAKKEKKALEGTSDSDSSDCEGLTEQQKSEKKEKKRVKKIAKKERKAQEETSDSDFSGSSSDYDSSSDSSMYSSSDSSTSSTESSRSSSSTRAEGKEGQSEVDQMAMYTRSMGVTFATEADDMDTSALVQQELEMPDLTSYTKPLFVYGPSGSGKTALLAKMTMLADGWFEKDVVKIIRFLGTSPGTSSLKSTLLGICGQICTTYKHDTLLTLSDLEKDFSLLCAYFHALLRKIDTETKPLLIVLDSLDQLNSDDYVFTMNWLQIRLPPGVMLILSMLPDHQGALDSAKKLLSKERFLEVAPLPKDTATQIMDTWLAGEHRAITTQQREALMTVYKTCPQPLFLKIAFEDAKTWKSYMMPDEIDIGVSIRSAIEMLFIRLERSHGQVMVARALGYLTISKNGLSAGEMEDILSLDDEVLQDTYLYHLPASDTLIRLPSLLWRRIQYDMQPYLTIHRADKKNLVAWYHRQFAEAARNKYAKEAMLPFLHTVLADYFIGKWANVVKPLELYKKKKGSYPFAERGVPEQPIVFSKGGYNERKMSELPHHLTESRDFARFAAEINQSLEFLLYKVKTTSVVALLLDLSKALAAMSEMSTLPKPKSLRRRVTNLPKETTFITKDNTQMISGENDEAFEELEDSPEDEGETSDGSLESSEAGSIGGKETSAAMDLQSVRKEVMIVHDMLLLGMDAISKDPNNLPIQLLGQMGPTEHPVPGVETLRQAAHSYVKTTSTPLLVPHTWCLPTLGSELRGMLDIAIAFPGDAAENECKVALTRDGRFLYAIDRQKDGDLLKIIDLQNNASVMKRQKMAKQDVMRVALMANDQYLCVDVYTRRDKYSPQYKRTLVSRESQLPIPSPPGYEIVGVSDSGNYGLLASSQPPGEQGQRGMLDMFKGESRPDKPADQGTVRMVNVGAILNLKDFTLQSIKVQAKKTTPTLCYGCFSPDDKHLVIFCSDQRHYIVSTEKGKVRHGFGDFGGGEMFFGDRPINEGKVKMFINNTTFVMPQLGYEGANTLEVIDVEKGKIIHELRGHNYKIDHLALSEDRTLLASATSQTSIVNGDNDKFAYVWDLEKGTSMSVCRKQGPDNNVAFAGSHSDYLMVSSWRSNELTFWYIGTRSNPCVEAIPIYRLVGHNSEVITLLVTPDSKSLITASTDNTIKFWSLPGILATCQKRLDEVGTDIDALQQLSQPPDRPYRMGEGPITTTAITVSKDGAVAAVGTEDGWVIFYDLTTMQTIRYESVGGSVTSLLTSRSGEYIVSATTAVHVWDPKTGKLVRELKGSKRPDCIAEARHILVVGEGGMEAYGHLYNLDTGEKLSSLQGLYGFHQVVISSDAKRVVSTFFDFPLIYDVESSEAINFTQPDTMMYGSSCLLLSPNDKYVASGSMDGSVRVSLLDSGKYVYRMQHKSSVRAAVFSNNASILLTAGFKNILVWSMADGSLSYMLSRHQNFINHLRFVCRGRYLVSCSDDKQIVIWDMRQGSSVAHFSAHCPVKYTSVADDLSSVLFSPDNVDYLGVLKPNDIMQKIVRGQAVNRVSEPVQTAQAFAFAFSNQAVTQKTSQSCTVL